jgi:hypothetical protein
MVYQLHYWHGIQGRGEFVWLALGVWAAEGFENWTENFDLSEQLTPRHFGEGKGSGTPENITF